MLIGRIALRRSGSGLRRPTESAPLPLRAAHRRRTHKHGLPLPRRGRGVPQGVPGLARREPRPELAGDGLGGMSIEFGGERLERLRAWNRTLADARYAAIAWPEEWGGRGAGRDGAGRLRRGDAPRPRAGHAQPARAVEHRARDHRARHRGAEAELLPRMLRGDDIWCQGFSEPNAGSDLASLRMLGGARRRQLDRERPEDVEHARHISPTGASCSCAPTRRSRSTRASRACSST